MFSFFKKKQPHERDLEHTISAVAEHHRDEDLQVIYALMKSRRVFVPVKPGTIPSTGSPGETIVTGPTDRIHLRTVTGPAGEKLVPAATTSKAAVLADGFVEMSWTDVLAMVLSMDSSAHGVCLQGERSWIVLDRERVRYVLSGAWQSRVSR
jgi:hypothetical protein